MPETCEKVLSLFLQGNPHFLPVKPLRGIFANKRSLPTLMAIYTQEKKIPVTIIKRSSPAQGHMYSNREEGLINF